MRTRPFLNESKEEAPGADNVSLDKKARKTYSAFFRDATASNVLDALSDVRPQQQNKNLSLKN